ncbi:hypothetical protein [Empedobacter brevis]|uniref:hypothetical protein n=1 Tax=Empedobacter brevis TaxID=247 RepID=UPI0028AF9259|nr:hypothetical protein [Empedobacter brevis]
MSYDENRISDLIDGGIQKENELFKGTKGDWKYYKNNDGTDSFTVSTQDGRGIFVSSFNNNTYEREANALLISKAPEMLKMLQEVYKLQCDGEANDKHVRKRILELIKQATEL